jgi:hypothetical protein
MGSDNPWLRQLQPLGRFNSNCKILEAAKGNEAVMNLASAIDCMHGEGITERHVDPTQFDAFALG